MARIRIIDEWLRSPAAQPVRARAVMVVADTWAEQKVLMRAYQACPDQSRPSIMLHGVALAMGPAGVDPHGAWGVHVDANSDGRAQELREQLEAAAYRIAGGKPARLLDEESAFERKSTNQWAPGSPRDRISQGGLDDVPPEPGAGVSAGASADWSEDTRNLRQGVPEPEVYQVERRASLIPAVPSESSQMAPAQRPPAQPQVFSAHPDARTIMPFGGSGAAGAPPPAVLPQRTTPRGWQAPPSGVHPAQTIRRTRTPPPTTDGLGKVVGHTMPLGFQLSADEREVLNRLGQERRMTARQIAALIGADDGIAWMETMMTKLANHGLDIVAPGDDVDGEPTYILRN